MRNSPPRLGRRRAGWARIAAGLTTLTACLLVGAAPASAHAQLESTYPDPSSVLLASPGRVELRFGEPVEIDFGSIRVIGPHGGRVDHGGTHHPPGAPDAVETALPAHLPAGTYVVAWRVVSADSHPVHGAYLFDIGRAGPPAKGVLAGALAGSGDTTVGVVAGLLRFVVLSGLLVLVGVATAVTLLVPAEGSRGGVRLVLWVAWAAVAVSSAVAVAVQGAYAAGLPLSRAWNWTVVDEVLGTRFGQVQLVRLVLLAVFVPVLLAVTGRIGRGARRWWLVPGALVGLGLLLTPGLAGHASTSGTPAAGIPLDLAHMASASVWVGGIVLLAVLWTGRAGEGGRSEVTDVARGFSPWALGAVVVVVASGVVQSLREVGSLYALTHTTYGRTLLVKAAFVTILLGLGVVSRRLARTRDRRLRWSVVAEVAVAGAVLVATALLVDAAPARQAAALPFAQTFEVLGLQVNAVVQPARVGPGNRVHVYVLTASGTPRAVPEVDASLSLPAAGIGPLPIPLVVAGPGHYLASDVDIPVAGDWLLRVTVRTTATDEQQVRATVPVH